jgi:DNA-binding transcriptional regulator YiaG
VNKREAERAEHRAAKGHHHRFARKWLKSEDALLREFYATESRDFIMGRLPGRTWPAILHNAQKLRLRRSNKISPYIRKKQSIQTDLVRSLVRAREKKGWTIADLANKVGYSYAAVAGWETEKRPPSPFALHAWCDALDMELTVREKR